MITRHIAFFTIAIALLLGSSGAWGARLMQGPVPQRPSEETLPLQEAQGPREAPGTAFPMIDSGSEEPGTCSRRLMRSEGPGALRE
jgi:hypothetical protein